MGFLDNAQRESLAKQLVRQVVHLREDIVKQVQSCKG